MEYLKKSLKILIVDDNETDLELLEAILVKIGFEQIITARSGSEAIRLAKEHQPGLFFIDVMMPEMTGGEFRELLKEDPATKDIPVVFISGIISKAEESQLGGQLASGDLIVAKPFSVTSIAEVIVSALKKSRKSYLE